MKVKINIYKCFPKTALHPKNHLYIVQSLTTDGDVTELHADPLVQCEAPGGLVLVPRVAAVRVSSVQLWVADGQVAVAVRILGVPRLTLPARPGHTDGPSVVCPAVVVTLVIWR